MRFFSRRDKLKHDSKSSPKIIVDGPNLSKDQNVKGEVAEAKRFCVLIKQLCEEYDIDHVEIFVSAKLKHEIDNLDIIESLQKDGSVIVTPASRDDDYFALKHAIDSDAWIISNDRYRDWQAKNDKLRGWLKKRRITFVWHKKDQRFTFGENITYLTKD